MKKFYKRKLEPIVKKPYFAFLIFGIVVAIIGLLNGIIPPDIHGALASTAAYSLAGLGFTLLLGYGGLASLGTGAFVGVGLFGLHYFYRYAGLPLLIVIAIAILISIVISIIFGFVSLRISGMYLAIVTMALSQIVIEIIKNIPQYASGTSGGFLANGPRRPLEIFGALINFKNSVVIMAVFLVIGMIIIYNLIHSATGRALLAIKNNETAAQTMGINLIKYRLFAFVISGIFGTLAGVLNMLYYKSANVSSIGLVFALNILAAVIVGGMRSIWGIILGSFIIFGLDLAVFQKLNIGNYGIIINGVLIIIVVMYYPNGLIQLFTDMRLARKKYQVEKKERIYGKEE